LVKGDANCWYGSTQVLPKKASLASKNHDVPYMYRQTGGQTYQIVYMQVMNGLGVLGFYHAGTFMENNLSPESVADPETD
jgi:hypothetical protein